MAHISHPVKDTMEEKAVKDPLRTFHDVAKAINSTLDIDRVVELILEKTSDLLGAGRVLILVLDKKRKVLRVHGHRGFASSGPKVRELRVARPFNHCIVDRGMVITLGEILSSGDIERLSVAAPELLDMIFAPLEVKGESFGLLGVSDSHKKFSDTELEIFCALGSQAAVAMENASLYKRLKDAFLHTSEALAEAVNSRDPYTGGHVRRVENYSLLMGEALGLDEKDSEDLRLAAILHDIGKIGIDDAILRKAEPLSPEEEAMMQRHPEIGGRIMSFVTEMRDIIPGVRHHHENYDGSGYPDGLKGEDIPLHARIIAIADAFDALTTDRPYRKAVTMEEALGVLRRYRGSRFDPGLVDIFCRLIKESGARSRV